MDQPRKPRKRISKPVYKTEDSNRSISKSRHSQGSQSAGDDERRTNDSRGQRPRVQKPPYYKNNEKKTYGKKRIQLTRKPRRPDYEAEPLSDEIRLNKYIANSGICSRREADVYIKAGLVTVNGKIVSELGVKVKPSDDVRYNNERITPEKKVYVLLNKPKDFTTTVEDPHADKTVMDLVKTACRERIFPVGRLDKKTTGVLLLTNDGELSAKLIHPKQNKRKIYYVTLLKPLTKADMQKIADGIELEDGPIRADEITFPNPDVKTEVGIELHSGRNRIVRRIFESLGYKVIKLDRVYFAGLTKKGLPRGKWRFLTQKEVNYLKMNKFT